MSSLYAHPITTFTDFRYHSIPPVIASPAQAPLTTSSREEDDSMYSLLQSFPDPPMFIPAFYPSRTRPVNICIQSSVFNWLTTLFQTTLPCIDSSTESSPPSSIFDSKSTADTDADTSSATTALSSPEHKSVVSIPIPSLEHERSSLTSSNTSYMDEEGCENAIRSKVPINCDIERDGENPDYKDDDNDDKCQDANDDECSHSVISEYSLFHFDNIELGGNSDTGFGEDQSVDTQINIDVINRTDSDYSLFHFDNVSEKIETSACESSVTDSDGSVFYFNDRQGNDSDADLFYRPESVQNTSDSSMTDYDGSIFYFDDHNRSGADDSLFYRPDTVMQSVLDVSASWYECFAYVMAYKYAYKISSSTGAMSLGSCNDELPIANVSSDFARLIIILSNVSVVRR